MKPAHNGHRLFYVITSSVISIIVIHVSIIMQSLRGYCKVVDFFIFITNQAILRDIYNINYQLIQRIQHRHIFFLNIYIFFYKYFFFYTNTLTIMCDILRVLTYISTIISQFILFIDLDYYTLFIFFSLVVSLNIKSIMDNK